MRAVTKKILESGLVDKHAAAMLARWGTIEQDDAHRAGRQSFETKEQLEAFAEELEELLEREADITRETPFEVHLGVPFRFVVSRTSQSWIGCRDKLDHIICSPKLDVMRGDILHEDHGMRRQVLDINKLYRGDEVHALELTAEIIK
jgi:hypothetical protein